MGTLLAGGSALLLLLAGCTPTPANHDSTAGRERLDPFLSQKLTFEECDDKATGGVEGGSVARAECSRLLVPVDYADPDGETANIAVLRVPARSDDPTGSILVNPGGPGSGGTSMALMLAETWTSTALTNRFDLIGFDPPGVGASTPAIARYSDAEREGNAPLFSPLSGATEWESPGAEAFVDQCAKRSGGSQVLAHVGTRDVVRDMDILRTVLGDEKLTYVGTSYGTRLGAVCAEMFPKKVRALVLDGPLDPSATKQQRRVSQFTAMQGSFDGMVELCVQQADCPLGTDPSRALDTYLEQIRDLDENHAPTADGRVLTTADVTDAVFAGLYSSAVWPTIIAGLAELRTGTGNLLMTCRDLYHERAADGTYSDAYEALVAINCVDDDRGTTVEASDVCATWPGHDPVQFDRSAVRDDLPETLVVAGTEDPATPYEDGKALASALDELLLTVKSRTHGSVLMGSPCVEQAIADYLIDLTLPAKNARCSI
ncbi:alpha/beta hydrolase [Cryobacterium sp. PH31-O1]|uniref:alpha/beta hydrolase n=1 Tax=Cryobacterium sp. PH31-O1 TaxID=3046306 RepID=UPI0024B92CBE|nr:alpha/beta hydrolase [Cryobacterium sp. PH31-O1]MDJ0336648.1 alpha/beta hydrolase [Cryobacterium sp. PH31-O1]